MVQTTTLDAKDRLAEIEATLDERTEELEAIKDEARELAPDGDPSDLEGDALERYRELEDEYDDVDERIRELEQARDDVARAFREWDGSEFEIKRFRYGEQSQVNDLVRMDQLQDGVENPAAKLGSLKLRTIQVGTVSTPPNAPESPGKYPKPIGEWLYSCIEEYNRFGEVGLGNSSLSEALAAGNESRN